MHPPLSRLSRLNREVRTYALHALGLMAFAASLFALMNFFARVATASSGASWSSAAAIRSTVGALVAAFVARARRSTLSVKDHRALFWRSLCGTVSMIATFYALSSHTVSLGNTVTLLNLAPVFLALLAPFVLGERTTGIVALAIALALGGVVLIVRPAFLFSSLSVGIEEMGGAISGPVPGPSAALTVVSALTAALSTSIALLMLRRAGQTETPEAISFHFAVFAAIVTSVIALVDGRVPKVRDAALLVLAGVCGGVAQVAMSRAYATERAARVAGVSYLSPVVSAILGAVLLHERQGPIAIVGMALVIVAGVLVTVTRAETR
jgi:drug/metabolite transporter (DMT)-like permease